MKSNVANRCCCLVQTETGRRVRSALSGYLYSIIIVCIAVSSYITNSAEALHCQLKTLLGPRVTNSLIGRNFMIQTIRLRPTNLSTNICGRGRDSAQLYSVKRFTSEKRRSKARVGLVQFLLDIALTSPLWKNVLVPMARHSIIKTAEANNIEWMKALAWIRNQNGPWQSEVKFNGIDANNTKTEMVPSYYRMPFHAYEKGNLCWDAAFEQELASMAVGARNFPSFGKNGEEVFRRAFEKAILSMGGVVSAGGAVVDLGCGTGISTRRLAAQWPQASTINGIDLSPYFIEVGKKLLELSPKSLEYGGPWVTTVSQDKRITLSVGDAANTALDDECAVVVNLSLVIHELPNEVSLQVIDEAYRILKPGGQLWISEMDFESPAYAAQRSNAVLFSLLRATEPFVDNYADSFHLLQKHLLKRFSLVRISAATGRHCSLVAVKSSLSDAQDNCPGKLEDLRFNTDGSYLVGDTHLKSWESKKS